MSVVSSDYVKARWAYSELLSPACGYKYIGLEHLKQKASRGTRFEDLARSDFVVLVQMFDKVRGGYFNRYFAGIANFALARWTQRELGAVNVIPYWSEECGPGMATFKQWVEYPPASVLSEHHPKLDLSNSTPLEQVHPLTVGRDVEAHVLLDGYHRACRFWGIQDSPLRLTMYVPA
jgi:hypothetical protein